MRSAKKKMAVGGVTNRFKFSNNFQIRQRNTHSEAMGVKGAHLLRESERSREQAAAPEASAIGFSSHVRRRREGKAEQNDTSDN